MASLPTTSLNFGNVQIGTTLPKVVALSNSSASDVLFTASSDNTKFVVSPSSGTISANSSVALTVSYTPDAKTTDSGKVTVVADTTLELDLTGLGVSATIETTSSLAFGRIQTGQSKTLNITITNPSDLTLTVSGITSTDSQFQVVGATSFQVPRKESYDVSISFSPTSVGNASGQIQIESDDADRPIVSTSVDGTGISSALTVSPESLNFSLTSLSSGRSEDITFRNETSTPISIASVISSNALFIPSTTAFTIPALSPRTIGITFSPTSETKSTGTITFTPMSSSVPVTVVDVLGQGANPSISVDKTSINFGDTAVDGSSSDILTIQNIGQLTLTVTITTVGSVFGLDKTSISVDPNSSETVEVSFSPITLGDESGSLVLTTNDTNNPNLTISLTGTGANIPEVSVSPSSLSFGNTSVSSPTERTLTIGNQGTADLQFTLAIAPVAAFSSDTSAATVAPGGSEEIVITFSPDESSSYSGTATISSNDPKTPTVDVSLIGEGTAAGLQWTSFSLSDLIPDPVESIAEGIGAVVSVISSALALVKAVLNIIKIFLIDFSDPLKFIVQALIALVENFLADFRAAGIYRLAIIPGDKRINPRQTPQYYTDIDESTLQEIFGSVSDYFDSVRGGSSAFISKVIGSFDDPADGNRPQFTSDSQAGCLVLASDSDDLTEILDFVTRIARIFQFEFKTQFDPPTNINAIAGNGKVQLNFAANDGFLSNANLVFRSEVSGGTPTDPPSQDTFGRTVREYQLVGIVNTVSQLAEALDITVDEAENGLKQFGGKVSGFLTNLGEVISANFVYVDESVSNDQSYFYVIASASVDDSLLGSNPSIPDITTANCVDRIDPETGQPIPKDCDQYGINLVGPLSTEASGAPSGTFQAVEQTLARCRFYRCDFTQRMVESFRAQTRKRLKFEPIASTLNVDLEIVSDGTTEIVPSDYYQIDGRSLRFINDGWVEQQREANNNISVEYFYNSAEETREANDYFKDVQDGEVLVLSKKPIKTIEASLFAGTSVRSENGKIIILDAKNGLVQLNAGTGGRGDADIFYEYVTTAEDEDFYRCVNSEFNKYYFDATTCANGTTLCPGYENRNCKFNSGTACTNTETSGREVLKLTTSFFTGDQAQLKTESENIPYANFWDSVACQNGIMAQRCDGYSKVDPRGGYKGAPPNWAGYQISLLELLPPIKIVFAEIEDLLNSLLSGTEKSSDAILNFINLIEKKIENLELFIAKIESIITMINTFFSGPEFYILNVPPEKGGTEYLKEAILAAENGPDSDERGFTAGIVLAYGGPGADITALSKGFELFFG